MSQTQAKATRREIRRSMGAEALGVIEMHAGGINALAERVADQEARLQRLDKDVDLLEDGLRAVGCEAIGGAELGKWFTRMTFWARLRWLLRGV